MKNCICCVWSIACVGKRLTKLSAFRRQMKVGHAVAVPVRSFLHKSIAILSLYKVFAEITIILAKMTFPMIIVHSIPSCPWLYDHHTRVIRPD